MTIKTSRAPRRGVATRRGAAAIPGNGLAQGAAAERWRVDAGAADLATLTIPASAQRERVFDIDLRFVVRVPDPAAGAWHALRVEIDGVQLWSRRLASANPGQTDSLDYHCRRSVAVGRALRVRGLTDVSGAVRLQLLIEAEELPPA